DADSVTAVLFKIVQGPHEPLSDRAPHLPDTLVDVVERALSKNPDARPQTALEMRAALLAIANALQTPTDSDTTTVLLRMAADRVGRCRRRRAARRHDRRRAADARAPREGDASARADRRRHTGAGTAASCAGRRGAAALSSCGCRRRSAGNAGGRRAATRSAP